MRTELQAAELDAARKFKRPLPIPMGNIRKVCMKFCGAVMLGCGFPAEGQDRFDEPTPLTGI